MPAATARNQLKQAKRYVIKIGTNTLLTDQGAFNYEFALHLAGQIQHLRQHGREFILVSSGAIGLGRHFLGWKKSADITLSQTAASVGQAILMHHYAKVFQKTEQTISQVLLTHYDMLHSQNRQNIQNLLDHQLKLGLLPIINENDSVSTEDITFGDNDILSGYVSNMVKAEVLVLLTNVNGLYRNIDTQERMGFVPKITDAITECISEGKSSMGKGGMMSKILAAQLAAQSGTRTLVVNGLQPDVLNRISEGADIGTLFALPKKTIIPFLAG